MPDPRRRLTSRVLGYMITIICQGETPAQTYWWFLPKLYTGVLLLALNARIKLERELRSFAGVYVGVHGLRIRATSPRAMSWLNTQPPGSRNPDMAMPALRRVRFVPSPTAKRSTSHLTLVPGLTRRLAASTRQTRKRSTMTAYSSCLLLCQTSKRRPPQP